jgi:hypothetical protein
MRILIVTVAALWGIAAVLVFLRAKDKSADAKLTAAYILGYPVLVVALFLNEPVPMWFAVPAMFGLVPWILAGPHLWSLVRDPTAGRPDEIIGIPKAYWYWGGIGSVLLGLLFAG